MGNTVNRSDLPGITTPIHYWAGQAEVKKENQGKIAQLEARESIVKLVQGLPADGTITAEQEAELKRLREIAGDEVILNPSNEKLSSEIKLAKKAVVNLEIAVTNAETIIAKKKEGKIPTDSDSNRLTELQDKLGAARTNFDKLVKEKSELQATLPNNGSEVADWMRKFGSKDEIQKATKDRISELKSEHRWNSVKGRIVALVSPIFLLLAAVGHAVKAAFKTPFAVPITLINLGWTVAPNFGIKGWFVDVLKTVGFVASAAVSPIVGFVKPSWAVSLNKFAGLYTEQYKPSEESSEVFVKELQANVAKINAAAADVPRAKNSNALAKLRNEAQAAFAAIQNQVSINLETSRKFADGSDEKSLADWQAIKAQTALINSKPVVDSIEAARKAKAETEDKGFRLLHPNFSWKHPLTKPAAAV